MILLQINFMHVDSQATTLLFNKIKYKDIMNGNALFKYDPFKLWAFGA